MIDTCKHFCGFFTQRIKILCMTGIVSVCCLHHANVAQAEPVAAIRYAAELNTMPASCRVAAMGDAGVALPLDAAGLFWNTASPAYVKQYEVYAEYARLYGNLSSQGSAAFLVPLQDQMCVGGFYTRFASGDIQLWDSLPGTAQSRLENPSLRADGSSEGVFTNDQNLVVVSIAKVFSVPVPRPASYTLPLPIEFAAGVGFKDYWQTMNPAGKVRMGMNINADAGGLLRVCIDYDLVQKQVSREVYVGVSIKDFLGTSVVWLHSPDNYQETVDPTQYYGVSYVDKTDLLGAHWIASFAIQKSYEVTYHVGLEAQFFHMVALRAGWSDKVFTCGAGVTYKKYSLDYAFRFDDIDISPLRISLRASF